MRNKIKIKGERMFTTRLCTTTNSTTFYQKKEHLEKTLLPKYAQYGILINPLKTQLCQI